MTRRTVRQHLEAAGLTGLVADVRRGHQALEVVLAPAPGYASRWLGEPDDDAQRIAAALRLAGHDARVLYAGAVLIRQPPAPRRPVIGSSW